VPNRCVIASGSAFRNRPLFQVGHECRSFAWKEVVVSNYAIIRLEKIGSSGFCVGNSRVEMPELPRNIGHSAV
jgi:hypothetical protein